MLFDELTIEMELAFRLLKLQTNVEKYTSEKIKIYTIPMFGLKVYCISNFMQQEIQKASLDINRRIFIITTTEDFKDRKELLIWELMKSGYLKWLRLTYPRQFKDLIVTQNFGHKIIDRRLKLWGNKEKFKFFIEENKSYKSALGYALSQDTSFFDMIPEIDDLILEELNV